ncbi:MAG: aminotransferase class IV [Flavobacteriales bacterium]|nr:aminotransferase class IV [Flavobacteriales bacterium]
MVEATSSNIFLVIKGVVYSPPSEEGGVSGVMKRVVLNKLSQIGVNYQEKHLKVSDLKLADEVFVTNSIDGVKWVSSYQSKRYFKKISSQLLRAIN